MNRQQCLNKIFKISHQHHHDLDIEQTAIYILDEYNEYSKAMAYLSCIMAAKLHKRGYYHLQKASYLLDQDLYKLEKQVVVKLNYQLYNDHFISQVGLLNRKLSSDFLIISRYLSWYGIKAKFNTILLAIQMMKKQLLKFSKVYSVFILVSKKYDIDIKDLIVEYNLLYS